MSRFVSDIPATGQADAQANTKAVQQLLAQYRRLVRGKQTRMRRNAQAYVNLRMHRQHTNEPRLDRVFRDATFIAAHPTRYQAGGYVFEDTEYFVLHRPGIQARASRMDNIIREFLQDNRKAATHFIVALNGSLVQMVDLRDIAYHCGTSSGEVFNNNSVGVEIEGEIGSPISDAAYTAVAKLIAQTSIKSGMPLDSDHIVEHRELLPRRKLDVGTNLNKQRLVAEAQAWVPQLPSTDAEIYKPPFNPVDQSRGLVDEIMALAVSSSVSPLSSSVLRGAGGTSAAIARSMFFGILNRDQISRLASEWATKVESNTGRSLASDLALGEASAQPTPQQNNAGVLFDFTTGRYNDG